MHESVFKDLLNQSLISGINVQEVLPSKGKPALKELGSTTVWIIQFYYGNNQVETLEAARGGPREWASLDSLSAWLRSLGVQKFQTYFLPDYDKVPQQTFTFNV